MASPQYTFRPNMSVYIPSVTSSTTERQIKDVFQKLGLGIVSRVDFVEKDNNDKLMAFVHFDYWLINNSSYHLQENIYNKGQSKIVYNDPYYWIIMENQNPRSKTEIELEEKVALLQKRVKYLETVIACHTRKFIENGITTNTIACTECWTQTVNDENPCLACGHDSNMITIDVTPYHETVKENTTEEDEAAALAMTGALDMETGRTIENRHVNDDQPTEVAPAYSGWWPFHY